MLSEYRFIATMLLMFDALPHVARMSKCFQLTDGDYSIIPSILETTLVSLEQLKTHDGLNLSKCESFLADLKRIALKLRSLPICQKITSMTAFTYLFLLV